MQTLLGPWLYWPIVVIVIGFAATSFVSNISLIYTELVAQIAELRRRFKNAQ